MCRLTVRTGRGAAVGVVAKGVNVESALGVGVVAADVPGDGGRGRLGLLLEDDGAGDLGVTTEDGNCKERAGWLANANTRCFPIWKNSLASRTGADIKVGRGRACGSSGHQGSDIGPYGHARNPLKLPRWVCGVV